jgi:hypothetical protein
VAGIEQTEERMQNPASAPSMGSEQGIYDVRPSPLLTGTDRNSVLSPCSCVTFVSRATSIA